MKAASTASSIFKIDMEIPCPHQKCKAKVGKPCKGMSKPLTVHIARRIKSLLRGEAVRARFLDQLITTEGRPID
jgi:hypothetical protein